MTDTKMLSRLLDGTIDPRQFSHRDHLVVAYEALSGRDFFEAAGLVARGLMGIAQKAGAPQKFNATVTLAFLGLVSERMHRQDHSTPDAFVETNPDLLDRSLLNGWFSISRLSDDLAHAIALLPDRAPTVRRS